MSMNRKQMVTVFVAAASLVVVMTFAVYDVPIKLLHGKFQHFHSSQSSGVGEQDDTVTPNQTRTAEAGSDKSKMTRLERFLAERAVHIKDVDCKGVVAGRNESLKHAFHKEREKAQGLENDTDIARAASSCSTFRQRYGFITHPLTAMEQAFPLAFSVLTFKDAAQVVMLLRAIYRPQHSICIHADRKSPQTFHDAMLAVSRCLPGVFIASRSIAVQWGRFSVLEPDIVCMRDLWNSSKPWRYFINLTGQEFPIRTNYEMVKILTAYNGANDVHGFVPNAAFRSRWGHRPPAPHNLTVYSGAVHVTLSRGFVDFLLHSPVALDFLNWTVPTGVPDEKYFNTLNHNPHIRPPGGFKGGLSLKDLDRVKPYLTRLKNWVKQRRYPCPGHKVVRQLCIFSVLAVPHIVKQPHFYVNKFHHDYSRFALGCLAEELFNRTRDQALGRRDFNVSFYENLPFIRDKMTF